MAKSVRIWQKRKLRLDTLTFHQRDMVDIGSAGLLSVFKRLAEAKGPTDAAAKPLTKRYAIYKSKLRKGNRRNLFLTGQLLGGLKLRTVTDNRAYAAPDGRMRSENRRARKLGKTTRRFTNRDVGRVNMKWEPWLVFSPVNQQAVMQKARQVFARTVARLIRRENIG